MSKLFSIAVALTIAATAATAAQAQDPTPSQRIVAQERAKGLVQSATQAPVHDILAQERGRHSDPRLFQPSGPAPILVAGEPDRFDLSDAGVGGAAVVAVALVAAALALYASGRRQRAVGASSAGS
jgi:hypothetical protein